MIEKDTLIKVRNSTNSRVGYLVPELLGNLHRNFMPNEVKEVTFEEIQKLYLLPGGDVLLRHHLTIDNKEALSKILGNVDPEYFYTKKDIENLLTTGTIEQFMDFLDFAPEGMINSLKDLSVSLEINDIKKRELIKEKTGFDVTKAIEINRETKEEVESEIKSRRAAPIKQEENKKEESVKIIVK